MSQRNSSLTVPSNINIHQYLYLKYKPHNQLLRIFNASYMCTTVQLLHHRNLSCWRAKFICENVALYKFTIQCKNFTGCKFHLDFTNCLEFSFWQKMISQFIVSCHFYTTLDGISQRKFYCQCKKSWNPQELQSVKFCTIQYCFYSKLKVTN